MSILRSVRSGVNQDGDAAGGEATGSELARSDEA
jgi:hypothetical protein